MNTIKEYDQFEERSRKDDSIQNERDCQNFPTDGVQYLNYDKKQNRISFLCICVT